MPRIINPGTLDLGHGTVAAKTVDDNAFKYPERDVDPLRVHLHDPSRAHMAETIGIVDAADCYTSDEVEGALQEICSGMGAGRMNGLVEGGYIVLPVSPYPSGGTGLLVRLVAPGTGNPSTALINAHTLDISGFEYDFNTGVDPVGAAPTINAGTYYLYLETNSAAVAPNAYETLVASTTLPTVASEKIHIAQITHDGTNLTNVVDCRYFVANLDRKLPYTLRSGFPNEFSDEDTDTWSEALFQTLEAALWWIENYDGIGDTQEEKATIIVRGVQSVSQSYTLRSGTCLMGSGPDAKIVWTGQGGSGTFLTLAGDNIRIQDVDLQIDTDVSATWIALQASATDNVHSILVERCNISEVSGSLRWGIAFDNSLSSSSSTYDVNIADCRIKADDTAIRLTKAANTGRASNVRIIRCDIDGAGADYGIHCDAATSVHIEDCNISGGAKASGTHTGVFWQGGDVSLVGSDVTNWRTCVRGTDPSGLLSAVSRCNITADSSLLDVTGIHVDAAGSNVNGMLIEGNFISGAPLTPATVTADFEPFGIQIVGSLNGTRIIGNRVFGNWYNNNGANAGGEVLGGALGLLEIGGSTPTKTVVTGNVLRPGIVVDVECEGLTIGDNIIEIPANSANGYARDQIAIGAGSKDISITGNAINGRREAICGIGVFGDLANARLTETVTISGNTIRNHNESGILIGGGVANAIVADNVIETTYVENELPTAYGIWCFGMNPVGAAMAPAITGNTISRMARGIVVEGDQVGLARPDLVTITGNNINWCSTGSLKSYDDYDTMAAQGIVVAYARGVTITGNTVAGIGAIISDANIPVFPVGEVCAVGIQSFRSQDVNIVGNSVGDLYSSGDGANAGWSIGIGVDCFAPQGYTGTKTYKGYGIHSNKVFMPGKAQGNDRRYACIMFWAGDVVSAAASVNVSQVSITGNTCRGTSGTAGTSGPTGGYFDLIGASSIIYRHQAAYSGADPTCGTQGVMISNNICAEYGANGISFTTRGEQSAGGGAKQIVTAQNILIDGNTIENGGVQLTYVDETSVTKNGAIVAIAGGSSGIKGLTVSNNSASNFQQAGVALGVTGETAGDDSEMYDVSVTGNNIQKAITSANGAESYGVIIEAFDNSQTDCKMGRFTVSDNVLGCRESDPANITLDWGFLLKTFFTGNETGCGTGSYHILDNLICAKIGGIAFDMAADLATSPLTFSDVTVRGNQVSVPIISTGSVHHPGPFGGKSGGIGIRAESYNIRRFEIVNNRVRHHPGSVSGGGFLNFMPFMFRAGQGNGGVVGSTLDNQDVTIRGNYFLPMIGDPNFASYTPPAIWFVNEDSIRVWNIAITNNDLHGQTYLKANSLTTEDPDWRHFKFCDNSVHNSLLDKALYFIGSSADQKITNPNLGFIDFQICNNQMKPGPALTNIDFQIELYADGVLMEDWKVEGNTIEMPGTSCGGVRLTATNNGHLQNWSISRNTFKSAAQPFVVLGGYASSDVSTEVFRVDDNIMDGILFDANGWSPNYYPDAAIIVTGLTQGPPGGALADVGERQISICRNQIRNVLSMIPDIANPDDLNIEHAVIYYGPNPYLPWNGGAGAETAQWTNVHGLRIDDNSIHQCQNENGIYTNFTPAGDDITDISICRNTMGKGSSDSFTSEETINTGIKLKGRTRFTKAANPITGDHFNTSICDNQLYIIGGSGHTGGFDAARGIMVELVSEWYAGFGCYKNKAMKVDGNEVLLIWDGTAATSYGIDVNLTAATYGFSCSNNTLSCNSRDGNTTNDFTAGIRVRHSFDEDGIQVKADADNTLQPSYGNGVHVLGWESATQSEDTTNFWGTQLPNDQTADLQMVGWRNMSVCGNTVYGNCRVPVVSEIALPKQTGALCFLPVHYGGAASGLGDTRRMTIMPCIGFQFQNNVTTNSTPSYTSGLLASTPLGININWTAIEGHIAGVHDIEAGTSYLYSAWNISNNATRLYTTTDNVNNVGSAGLLTVPADIKGYDVYLHPGGYEPSGNNTGIMRGVVCGQNSCSMWDDPGGATGGYRYGWVRFPAGWCPAIGGSQENLNDNPYFIK